MTNSDPIPDRCATRSVTEWAFSSSTAYQNPFWDVDVTALFSGPEGESLVVPAFYDGDGTWRVRFSPGMPGDWSVCLQSSPADPELTWEGSFTALPADSRGYLRATPGQGWGLAYESGAPALILGDTTYNLFGMAYCGADVGAFMRRRAEQGFNLLRVRLPVSPFHPPDGYSSWQTRRTWPWGGSEQAPQFDRFNLDYFRTVDRVVAQAEQLGLGLEMIMEAWGFEYPFNQRDVFLPEYEQLWMRYLVARYDAYTCLYIWTLMNEYEYYPDGDWRYNPVADRWAMRMGRWLKANALHGHIVAVHNGPRMPAFAQRFARDPGAIDLILYQEWGTRDRENGWLAAGIEKRIAQSLENWTGAALFAEWGYERNDEFPLLIPGHAYCDAEHTRRGAWRGVFSCLGIIHGFENSWGPFLDLEHDQPGLDYLLIVRQFLLEQIPFADMRPAADLLVNPPEGYSSGYRPLVMAIPSRDTIAAYLPAGGAVQLIVSGDAYAAHWFDPVTGAVREASVSGDVYCSPSGQHAGHPQDWILVLRR